MDNGPPNYYQFPDSHDQHLIVFIRWLVAGLLIFLVLIISLIWFADRLLIHVPFSAETRFVKPYESLLEKYHQLDSDELVIEQYLQGLADNLAEGGYLEEGMVLKVHYLDQPEVNAFATLGGNIFVLRGLVESMPNENALAMVLAHEIAHVKHRDPIVSVSRGMALQIVYSFFAGDAGTIFNTGSELGMLLFSREQENRADLEALETLHRYYGHVTGATTFFSYLQDESVEMAEVENLPSWLLSHSKLQERIEVIDAYVDRNHWVEGEVRSINVGK